MWRCLPCVMDRHDECDVDTGRSILSGTPCSCSEEHAPRPKKRVIQRRKR